MTQAPIKHGREDQPHDEERVDLQCRAHRRVSAPAPELQARQPRTAGRDERLTYKHGKAGAEKEKGNADGDVVDAGQIAYGRVQEPKPAAGDAGRYHAEPWRSGQIGDSEPAHRPHDQGPFEPEIHATALFRKRLAETDEEIGGRDADRAADDGDEHTRPAELKLVHARLGRQRP